MAKNIKNSLPPGDNWLADMTDEEAPCLEPYMYAEGIQIDTDSQKLKQPSVIGILPVRNIVVYPGTITPLAIGRKRSKALLADIDDHESVIGLLTQ